ncbi:MAG: SpoIID/LytB domain-containing protein [Parabacteroides sp.]
MNDSIPTLHVGILSGKAVQFAFCGTYELIGSGSFWEGEQQALWADGAIDFAGRRWTELCFRPVGKEALFELADVTIGIQFHWQRKERQRFSGLLRLWIADEQLVVINEVDVESYLTSVISSEMSATASKALLKAHAVISRSWVLAQIAHRQASRPPVQTEMPVTEGAYIRWYDHEDHTLFDVCADDHCQRYQGVTRIVTPKAREAVEETAGEVLMEGDTLCDTRFSKCCGGVTERFESCWEPVSHPCLQAVRDADSSVFPDLTQEEEAARWIRQRPTAYCATRDAAILRQVLNRYDQETTDFYRWQVCYSQEELAGLIARKSGRLFGRIVDLRPIERGPSGRIVRLEIVGTERSLVIGKELEIRRTLAETHLYSSAFVVDKEEVQAGIPGRFRLTGAGWGHGVGLCQIGAAIMGAQGFDYRQILSHYYPGSRLCGRYGSSDVNQKIESK